MNIKQMKSALGRFRNADVSVIKDEKLRAKAQKLQAKQGGFTLLELLVVITLLAVLSTAALIAYEGVGDNAEAAQAANTAATIDRAIRTFKAVEGEYPDQWDNLADWGTPASQIPFAPDDMATFLASWTLNASAAAIIEPKLAAMGMEELQFSDDRLVNNVAPNRAHNESANPGQAHQVVVDPTSTEYTSGLNTKAIAVVPTGACPSAADTALGVALPTSTWAGTTVTSNDLQNSFADVLEADACHFVVAFGFGGDAAASTTFSRVAIAQSPVYGHGEDVDPAVHYGRYIGLFHVGEWDEDNSVWDFREEPRLMAVVTPDGKTIDELVFDARNAE